MNAGPEKKQRSEGETDMTTPDTEDIETATGDDATAEVGMTTDVIEPESTEPDNTDDAAGDSEAGDGEAGDDGDAVDADAGAVSEGRSRRRLGRIIVGVGVAVIIALAAASTYFGLTHRANEQLREEHPAIVSAARDGATAVLSYRAESVEADVAAAQERLTGPFADEYRALAQNEVLPAAKERRLTSTAQVSGASLVHADSERAQTLVFVTQSVVAAGAAAEPTTTTAAFRVGLSKHDGQWLIEGFEPI
ncbi:hypothetical protein GOHSU_04_02270 [Gordonia hirsuta DSM 44140 = NBRC 16056]|uniref:Mce-associated membrane protein n=1 Tax=Gordonia hirsuta DSM 44140 = NBRC 16056 TaxID=1121927 RepID=L7L8H6_9ACTN|nr:hypothetical protein [Gordonia hirsuta]GAC56357.1 hypothetical protein GOHSU_04_02270 [Gordonia hirsuta DSM 44140 = NBRC 16056]